VASLDRPGAFTSLDFALDRLADKGGLAPDLAIGVALGAAFFSVVMAVLLATGAYTLTGPTAAAAWLPLADSLEGTVEELIFRGSIFRLLSGVLGIWWALGLSSASFGAWHLVKPGAEMMAVLGVICAGGIPLAALYMLTGRLWASIGYHVAWNFTEAYVFGADVTRMGRSNAMNLADPRKSSVAKVSSTRSSASASNCLTIFTFASFGSPKNVLAKPPITA
jgi:membrane protease YdiL (CAAX protease family)